MEIVNPIVMASLKTYCCSTAGKIQCDNSGNVTGINFGGLGLNGTMNGSALPSKLLFLNLNFNKITGSLSQLPPSLVLLQIVSNTFTGTLPRLPTTLISFIGHTNQFSGVVPTSLPSALQTMNLGSNKLSGTIPVLPNSMRIIHLDNNKLVGLVPPLPNGLTYVRLANNQLNGTFEICLNNNASILINNNLFIDVWVENNFRLVNCDISQNPLLTGCQYKSLTMCTQDTLTFPSVILNQACSLYVDNLLTSRTIITILSSTIEQFTIAKTDITTQLSVSVPDTTSDYTLIIIFGILGILILVTVVAANLFKAPSVRSTFGRRNSFSSLYTTNSTPGNFNNKALLKI